MADAIERRAGLGDRLADVMGGEPDYAPSPMKFPVKDGPDVAFTGWEMSSYATNPDRTRWAELMLWRTIEGNYVAGRAWHSSNPGESTFWTAEPVETVADAMDVWSWDSVAKAFARKLKLDVVRRVP